MHYIFVDFSRGAWGTCVIYTNLHKEEVALLRNVNELSYYVLQASDGQIGRCKDFLYSENDWAIRYMVADTRKWLPGRKVLISTEALETPDWERKIFPVDMTKTQIRESPPLESDQPVSRQLETRVSAHAGMPYYWLGSGNLGAIANPDWMPPDAADKERLERNFSELGRLRSADEVIGYYIQAQDGEIGHVEDLLVDDQNWMVRYMIIDTRNWLPGRKVILSPNWAHEISWRNRHVAVARTREQVKQAPEFNPSLPVDRGYETRLHTYYDMPPYWE